VLLCVLQKVGPVAVRYKSFEPSCVPAVRSAAVKNCQLCFLFSLASYSRKLLQAAGPCSTGVPAPAQHSNNSTLRSEVATAGLI
jgi:hypothetical protein